MKLKLDESGNAVLQDGKPVYIHDDGKEIVFDGAEAFKKINDLSAEAKNHRVAKEKAESELKKFEGIDDPEVAKKAIETVKNLDDKKLIDAGEVEKVKSEVTKVFEERLSTKDAELLKLQSQFNSEVIGGSFARSTVISEKLAIPSDMAQAFFGRHFSINEDGKLIAKDNNGGEIYSRTNPGQLAGFDEALEALIDTYPNKDSILKPSGSQGGNLQGGQGSGGVTAKSLADCKTDDERVEYLKTVQ